jgi:cell division protein FtsL
MFLTGVNFFVGISSGSFLAMGLTNSIVGFPVSSFKLIASLVICLVLCCTMVVFYDSEERRLAAQAEQEEEEHALIGAETGSSEYKLLVAVVV